METVGQHTQRFHLRALFLNHLIHRSPSHQLSLFIPDKVIEAAPITVISWSIFTSASLTAFWEPIRTGFSVLSDKKMLSLAPQCNKHTDPLSLSLSLSMLLPIHLPEKSKSHVLLSPFYEKHLHIYDSLRNSKFFECPNFHPLDSCNFKMKIQICYLAAGCLNGGWPF